MPKMRQIREFATGPDDENRRLDRIVRRFLPDASLPAIYKAIRTGSIRVNGKKAAPATRIPANGSLQIDVALFETGRGTSRQEAEYSSGSDLGAEDVPILLETQHLLFISKPHGVLTHGANGLDMFVRARYPSSTSLAFVPAPLHRLDRNTTGVVVCSRTIEGARVFSALLRDGGIHKRYIALLEGELRGSGQWTDFIERDGGARRSRTIGPDEKEASRSGQYAETSYDALACAGGKTLAMLDLGTGRTHQIRVQAASHGHPLAGDTKYGGKEQFLGYLLHAWTLGFDEPPFDDVPSVLVAPLPEKTLEAIGSQFGEDLVRRLAHPEGAI